MDELIAANLVVGRDGSTTLGGRSKGLSVPADRERFHEIRRGFNAIVIGGNTARNEPYAKAPLPIIILTSRGIPDSLTGKPNTEAWDMSIIEALANAKERYHRVLLESGPALLQSALAEQLVGELFLTIVDKTPNENPINIAEITRGFEEISREVVTDAVFLHLRLAPTSQ